MTKNIKFENKEHENKFNELCKRMHADTNHTRAIAYLIALIGGGLENELFDFERNIIKSSAINAGWQTSNTMRATTLLITLASGYRTAPEKGNIHKIFGYNYWDRYYIEALRIYFDETISSPVYIPKFN